MLVCAPALEGRHGSRVGQLGQELVKPVVEYGGRDADAPDGAYTPHERKGTSAEGVQVVRQGGLDCRQEVGGGHADGEGSYHLEYNDDGQRRVPVEYSERAHTDDREGEGGEMDISEAAQFRRQRTSHHGREGVDDGEWQEHDA